MSRCGVFVLLTCVVTVLAGPQVRRQDFDTASYNDAKEVMNQPCNEADNELMRGLSMTKLGDKFYYFSEFKRELKLNWLDSQEFCRSRGLELASIETEAENRLVAEHANKLGEYWDFWLGGTDVAREGRWVWSSTGAPVRFSAWRDGSPDNFGGNEHCLEIWTDEGVPNWSDDSCTDRNRFVCELNKPCVPA